MNSIIIPVYIPHVEVLDKLKMCVASIMAHTADPFELVVVEQGERLWQALIPVQPQAHVHLQKPVGFAKAVNIGVHCSTGDFLFIVNSDIIVPQAWDIKLRAVYAGMGSAAGVLCPTDQHFTEEDKIGFDVGWWSCVLISRRVWDDVGPLDEKNLPMRFHDQDWNIRCRQHGLAVARYYGVQVQHDEGSTYRHVKYDDADLAERQIMRERYGHEHFCQWVAGRQWGR